MNLARVTSHIVYGLQLGAEFLFADKTDAEILADFRIDLSKISDPGPWVVVDGDPHSPDVPPELLDRAIADGAFVAPAAPGIQPADWLLVPCFDGMYVSWFVFRRADRSTSL